MGKKKSLWRKNRYGAWYKLKEPEGKKVRFIPCDEDKQIYSWTRTNKKATENFNGGPTGAVWKRPKGPVHEYLNRDKEDKEEQVKQEGPDLNDDYPF
jgi:hypothetical protein